LVTIGPTAADGIAAAAEDDAVAAMTLVLGAAILDLGKIFQIIFLLIAVFRLLEQ